MGPVIIIIIIIITGQIRKCIRAYMETIDNNPNAGYIPNCDKIGQYLPEQCDTNKSKTCYVMFLIHFLV